MCTERGSALRSVPRRSPGVESAGASFRCWLVSGNTRQMPNIPPCPFDCPHRGAKYRIVRVEAPQGEPMPQVECQSCGGPFQGRVGGFILKYFLVDRPSKR